MRGGGPLLPNWGANGRGENGRCEARTAYAACREYHGEKRSLHGGSRPVVATV